MRVNERMKKVFSILLCLCVVLQYVPATAFAAAEDGLCAHHTEHTAACGYVAAVEGSPCTHEHDEACGYVAPVAGSDCTHVHDEVCGFVEAADEVPCGYVCEESHEEESSEEPAPFCTCGTDDTTHAITCAVYVAPEDPVCYCAEKCTEPNEWCDICGFDYTACTGTDTAAAYTESTTIYFNNTAGWTNVNVYYWGGTSSITWPGEAMTHVEDGIWSCEIPSDAVNVIFNNGSGSQTADLTIPTDGNNCYNFGSDAWTTDDSGSGGNGNNGDSGDSGDTDTIPGPIYFNNTAGWEAVYAYTWNADGPTSGIWPGKAMTHVEGTVYSIEVPDGEENIIFNNGNGGEGNLTADLTIPTDGGNCYDYGSGAWTTYNGDSGDTDARLNGIRITGDTVAYNPDTNTYTVYFPAGAETVSYDTVFSGRNLANYQNAPGLMWRETIERDGAVVSVDTYDLSAYNYFSYNGETGELIVTGTPTSAAIGLAVLYEYSNDGGATWVPACTQEFAACPHTSFENGICTICGAVCSHTGGDEHTCMGYKCDLCGEWYGPGNADNHLKIGQCDCGFTTYPVWVCGVQFTNSNLNYPGFRGVSYDPEHNILHVSQKFGDPDADNIALKVIGDITVQLDGNCTVYGNIDVTGNLTINGKHALTVNGYAYGIKAASVTFGDGIHVIAKATQAVNSTNVSGDGYSRTDANGEFASFAAPGSGAYFEYIGKNLAQDNISEDHCSHTLTCACGCNSVVQTGGHTTDATCQSKAVCSLCGEYGDVDANNHVGTLGAPVPSVDGTHTVTWDCCKAVVTEYCAEFEYPISNNGATCTLTCADCKQTMGIVTIVAPTCQTYGDGNSCAATLLWDGKPVDDAVPFNYYKGDTALTAAPTDAGTYRAEYTVRDYGYEDAEGSDYPGYEDIIIHVEYTIAPATITVDMITLPSTVYTGSAQNPDIAVVANGVTLAHGTDYSVTVRAEDYINAGSYDIEVVGKGNYTGSVELTFTIVKAEPAYNPPAGLAATYGDTLGSITLPYGFSWQDALTTSVGDAGEHTFMVTFTPADTVNYKVVEDIQVTVAVAKAVPTVTAPTANSRTYDGSAQPLVTAGSTSGGTIVYSMAEDGTYGSIPEASDAGEYTVYYKVVGDSNHNDTEAASIEVKIKKAPLTITADNNSITYGDVPAANGVTGTGFMNTENFHDLSGELTYTYSYEQYGNVGTYAITPGGLSSDNYEITYMPGELTVNPKAITVQANAASKTYGEDDPALTYAVSGLVGADQLEGKLVRAEGETVGTYAINQGTLTAGGNYIITFTGADFAITQRDVTVTAKDQTITYGETISGTEIMVSGLMDGHSIDVTLTPSTANVTVNGTITASTAVITSDGKDVTTNYEISYGVSAKLVIEPDTSKIDALTTENVTSANEEDIKAVQEMMETAESIKDEWAGITETCEDLLETIEAVQKATDTENTDKVEHVTADNVKPEDKDTLENAKADLEKALEDNADNYTEDEKQTIRDEIQRMENAVAALKNAEDVADSIAQLPDAVEPDDEAAAEKILDAKKAYDDLTDHEKSLVDEASGKKLDDLVTALTAYDIIKGDGDKWTEGNTSGLSFTANGPFSKFVGVEVDGKEVDAKYYDAKSGSTVITLKQSYLKKLSDGKHTITVLYTDGETTGTFQILAQSTSPATGDDSNIMLWTGLLCVSTLTLVVLLADRKRRISAE